jgi:hypothetical protein
MRRLKMLIAAVAAMVLMLATAAPAMAQDYWWPGYNDYDPYGYTWPAYGGWDGYFIPTDYDPGRELEGYYLTPWGWAEAEYAPAPGGGWYLTDLDPTWS